jgi:hypothetical protein
LRKKQFTGYRHHTSKPNPDPSRPVSVHYNNPEHCLDNLKIQIIDTANNDHERKYKEQFWICQLMSDTPFGLNIEFPFNRYKPP